MTDGTNFVTATVALAQDPANPFTSGANARGISAESNRPRSTILDMMTRMTRASFAANRRGVPAGWTNNQVTGLNNGFQPRGHTGEYASRTQRGCGPCVGVIIYNPTDPTAETYAFHFGFDPAESPGATFQREITDRVPNWADIRGNYRAVICGAELLNDQGDSNRRSVAMLTTVVNRIRNTLEVTIVGYVAAPGVAVDRAGNLYWTTPDGITVSRY